MACLEDCLYGCALIEVWKVHRIFQVCHILLILLHNVQTLFRQAQQPCWASCSPVCLQRTGRSSPDFTPFFLLTIPKAKRSGAVRDHVFFIQSAIAFEICKNSFSFLRKASVTSGSNCFPFSFVIIIQVSL